MNNITGLKRDGSNSCLLQENVAKKAKEEALSSIPSDMLKKIKAILSDQREPFRFHIICTEENRPAYVVRKQTRGALVGEIQDVLGKGGLATVYKVHFLGCHIVLALKVAESLCQASDNEAWEHITRECDLLGSMELNKGLKGLPIGEYQRVYTKKPTYDDELSGFLMEIASHNYLKQMEMDKDFICFAKVGEEFKDIISGVFNLHNALRIMHGDIKPENFLCRSDGTVYITDFGKARKIESLWNRTDDDLRYNYVPREDSKRFNDLPGIIEELEEAKEKGNARRIHKANKEIDSLKAECSMLAKAIDIFAVGVVFYRRCSGAFPYDQIKDGAHSVVFSADEENERIPLKTKQIPGIELPSGLKELIEEMLDPFPEKRPVAKNVLERLGQIFPDVNAATDAN